MKRFNVTGLCVASEDYMVDISNKIEKIKDMVDRRCYFVINKARQYGKTTTLSLLKKRLDNEYKVASISFEGIDDESFSTSDKFCPMILRLISESLEFTSSSKEYTNSWINEDAINFELLGRHITNMCKNEKVVLMIDEVDKISNNKVFVNFLGMLRDKYMKRKEGRDYTFYSVILTGVHDIKNIKIKLISEGKHTPAEVERSLYNSPWNIAADFKIDMSFLPEEIGTMLTEYEEDHQTKMDIKVISEEIYRFTDGYPFLVSRICQHIDEELKKSWTIKGIHEAVKIIVSEKNTLFDDLFKNLENNKSLYDYIYSLLIIGEEKNYIINDPIINIGIMYGFLKNIKNKVSISNRIFEIVITDYFISKDSHNNEKQIKGVLQNDIVKNGKFDMELCLRKFAVHYREIFNENDLEFLERHGRLIFISYLRPLINGQGFYHIESQFTDLRKMDIVVDFGTDQFIIELKIWYGDINHKNAYEQLISYMKDKNADKGYLITFDFRKKSNKQPTEEWIEINGKKIFDVVL